MQRRSFIKSSCVLCSAIGTGVIMNVLESCSPMMIYKTEVAENKVNIPLTQFAKGNLQIVRVESLKYDIAVRKWSEEKYSAILLRCTHAANALHNSGNSFTCSLHGSTFDKEGNVTKGPAQNPLKKYEVEIKNDSITLLIN